MNRRDNSPGPEQAIAVSRATDAERSAASSRATDAGRNGRADATARELARTILELSRRDGHETGQRLNERRLAASIGVSRTPVRAALHLLESSEVVARIDGRWVLQVAPDAGFALAGHSDAPSLGFQICVDRQYGALGDSFHESELQTRYAVSRRVLVRALQELAADGLVERTVGYGWRFVNLLHDRRSQRASYDLRLALEPMALRLDSTGIDPRALARLRTAHEAMLDGEVDRASPRTLFEVNADFHLSLTEFSGNEFFVQAVRQQNQLRRVLEYASQVDRVRMRRSCEQHLDIVAALEAGELDAAADLLENHLREARALLEHYPWD